MKLDEGLFIDVFAGAGGASVAIEAATGSPVSVAINHNATAIAVHKRNHPRTLHLLTDVFSPEADPRRVARGRRISGAWFSPDCTHHSNARGGKPIEKDTRILAMVILDWLRATLVAVGFLENVPEFPTWGPLMRVRRLVKNKKTGKWAKQWVLVPDPKRKGETFRYFVGEIEKLGYRVEWRNLVACDYGAPTKRKRHYMVFRRDGLPIVWPAPTHGDGLGLKPFHTAAECIDWSIPGRSIFGRKHPLAEKTMWRIAQGLKRFVFENPDPFIVGVGGRAGQSAPTGMDQPVGTITSKNDRALVMPHLVKVNHGVDSKTGKREHDLRKPLGTITSGGNGHALIAATLQHSGNGERPGQRARTYDLNDPLGTVMATGQKHALISAYLARYFGDPKRKKGGGRVSGKSLKEPLPTVTSRDHNALAAVTLVNYRGTDEQHPGCWDLGKPFPTISAQGNHVAEVRAFLTAYYSDDHAPGHGQELTEPMRTITTKARLGLVTAHGVDYQITDITLRMLKPHELLAAQFGEYAKGYDLSDAKSQEDQVMLIGNSVSPPPAIALIRANRPLTTKAERQAQRAA